MALERPSHHTPYVGLHDRLFVGCLVNVLINAKKTQQYSVGLSNLWAVMWLQGAPRGKGRVWLCDQGEEAGDSFCLLPQVSPLCTSLPAVAEFMCWNFTPSCVTSHVDQKSWVLLALLKTRYHRVWFAQHLATTIMYYFTLACTLFLSLLFFFVPM